MDFIRNRKSQITIFIILGILLIVLLLFYTIITGEEKDLGDDVETGVVIEGKDDPVYMYVEDCLKKTSFEAIQHIGEHGGYNSLKDNNIRYSTDVTNSDAVIMTSSASSSAKEDFYAIPYYWYMNSKDGCANGCSFIFSVPYMEKASGSPSIEEELDLFIEQNIDDCLNSFDDFTYQNYQISPMSRPSVESKVNREDISFTLTYPLRIKKDNSEYALNAYYTTQDINFNEIYDLVYEIAQLQKDKRYLERMALNIISGYGSVNGQIPPVADSTFEFGSPGNMWVKSDVKNNVQEALTKYTLALRVIGSNNYVSIGDDGLEEKLLDSQMRIVLSRDYDLDVSFAYLDWWPIYFDLNCDGEICKPESFSNTFFILIGNQKYRFFYSLAYPVLVKVHDDKALNGEGFDYYFFLESNIKNNRVTGETEINAPEFMLGSNMFCKENQRNSGEYTFKIKNMIDFTSIDNVSVYYSCGGADSCNLGMFSKEFNGKLPICAGGLLTLVKDGYVGNSAYVSTELDKGADIGTLEMEPLRKRNITLNKLMFTKSGSIWWNQLGESKLEENQEATIILTKDTEPGEKEFFQAVAVSYENPVGEVSVIPGKYIVQVILMDKTEMEIPEEEREVSVLFSKKKFTVPGIQFNESMPFLAGGLEGNFTITGALDTSESLQLNVVSFEMGKLAPGNRKIEDLEIIGMVGNYTEKYQDKLGFRYK